METDFKSLKQVVFELKKELGVEARETLKLEKNSRGYNWEIKVFVDNSINDEEALKRLEIINQIMLIKFNQEDNKDGNWF